VSNDVAKVRMFRNRALEIRKIAKDIGEASCRASLVQMAEYYERLAAALEAKRKTEPTPPKRH
jgi:hypothetical protein